MEKGQSVSLEFDNLNSYSASNNLLSSITNSRVTINDHPPSRTARKKDTSNKKTPSLKNQRKDDSNRVIDCVVDYFCLYKFHNDDIDLLDWYFDDELRPSLRNDPNMQLISSYSDELENKNSYHFSCILSDTGIVIILLIEVYYRRKNNNNTFFAF